MGKYLGFSLLTRRVSKADFALIIERIQSRLAGWKGCMLNKLGRVTLAKQVILAIPAYTMQALVYPNSVCNTVDASIRNFIWREKSNKTRGWNLVN